MNLDGTRRLSVPPTSGMQPEALVVDAKNRCAFVCFYSTHGMGDVNRPAILIMAR